MDYDKIFEGNLERKFFYTDYPGKKMMVGRISLSNAVARLSKDEYYTFVTYSEGEELPKQYIPLNGLTSEDGTLFATLNPNMRYMSYICMNGGIQTVSKLASRNEDEHIYLLGPGPEMITLDELVMEQYDKYIKSQTDSSTRGR